MDMSRKDSPDSTKVPPGIIKDQRETISKAKAAEHPGTDKLLAKVMSVPADEALIEILKNTLTSVTGALKSYANALHKDRHHPLPFVTCQKEECIYGRTTIDSAIGIIADTSRIKEIDKELEPKEVENRKEARDDANNMLLDPGEFPLTEVNDG